jgi:hypothetical protein
MMNGALVGYKVLFRRGDDLYSPMAQYDCCKPGKWVDGFLEADEIPTDDNAHGIYATKWPDSPELSSLKLNPHTILVKLALSGKVIEYEFGYRAQYADILEIVKEY